MPPFFFFFFLQFLSPAPFVKGWMGRKGTSRCSFPSFFIDADQEYKKSYRSFAGVFFSFLCILGCHNKAWRLPHKYLFFWAAMLFSKQCVRHNAPFFFCFVSPVCWMITIPYTVDFHESKSSMTARFFSFVHSSRCCQIVSKASLNARYFFFFNLATLHLSKKAWAWRSTQMSSAHGWI